MIGPDKLSDDPQAARLFETTQIGSNVHGVSVGTTAMWSVTSVVLPEAVRLRSGIGEQQAEGYSFMAFAPRMLLDEATSSLFDSDASDILPATINFRQRSDVKNHSPKPDIQYRLKKDALSGVAQLDRFYLGESVDFEALDYVDKQQLREAHTVELIAELSDLPDDVSEVTENDLPRILGSIGSILGRELDATFANRQEYDELARSLGLTAVFYDEAESLIDFLTALSGEASS